MICRVAWLVYGTLDQPTGGYVYDRLVIDQLRSSGVAVEVISLQRANPTKLSQTVQQLLMDPVDVVVGDALCVAELGVIFEALAGRRRRLLLVHHFTSWETELSDTGRALLLLEERRALRAADGVITTSRTTAERLSQEYPDCNPRVVVPGADRLPCLPRNLPSGCVHLLGIGSLVPRKRWGWLLEALEQGAAPEVELHLVGDNTRDAEYARTLEARIAASPYLSSRVSLLGAVAADVLAAELAASDALVLPSSLEGYGMVLTEALRAGVPVIASNDGAIPEVVGTSKAALLFRDVRELGSQLHCFVRDATLRSRLQRAALEGAERWPTWAEAGARFREEVIQVMGTHGAGRPHS